MPLYWRAYHDMALKERVSRYEREFVRCLFGELLAGVGRRRSASFATRFFSVRTNRNLAFWRDFPKLSVGFIRNYVKRSVRALTHIADPLSAFC